MEIPGGKTHGTRWTQCTGNSVGKMPHTGILGDGRNNTGSTETRLMQKRTLRVADEQVSRIPQKLDDRPEPLPATSVSDAKTSEPAKP